MKQVTPTQPLFPQTLVYKQHLWSTASHNHHSFPAATCISTFTTNDMLTYSSGSSRAVISRLSCVLLVACVLLLVHAPHAIQAYRKPPFNGSIFGKRADTEGAGRTLAALCEVAAEACSVWFPGAPGDTN